MEEALAKYDESLEALEKQKETLELVMKKMGAEWEESGAGIGWMGDLSVSTGSAAEPLVTTAANAFITATTATASAIATATAAVVTEASAQTIAAAAAAATASAIVLPRSGVTGTSPVLTSIMHSSGSDNDIVGPSHEYLQTLLNVNEEILAESLASTAASITTTCDSTTNTNKESNAAAAAALLDDTITTKLLIDDYNNQQALLLHTVATTKDTTYNIAPQQPSEALLPISPPLPEKEAQQQQDTNSMIAANTVANVKDQQTWITPPITPSEKQ